MHCFTVFIKSRSFGRFRDDNRVEEVVSVVPVVPADAVLIVLLSSDATYRRRRKGRIMQDTRQIRIQIPRAPFFLDCDCQFLDFKDAVGRCMMRLIQCHAIICSGSCGAFIERCFTHFSLLKEITALLLACNGRLLLTHL